MDGLQLLIAIPVSTTTGFINFSWRLCTKSGVQTMLNAAVRKSEHISSRSCSSLQECCWLHSLLISLPPLPLWGGLQLLIAIPVSTTTGFINISWRLCTKNGVQTMLNAAVRKSEHFHAHDNSEPKLVPPPPAQKFPRTTR
eukprot:6462690-Amphidinium_carterae.1